MVVTTDSYHKQATANMNSISDEMKTKFPFLFYANLFSWETFWHWCKKSSYGWIPFSCFGVLVVYRLVHCHTCDVLLGHIISNTCVFLLWQLMSERPTIRWITTAIHSDLLSSPSPVLRQGAIGSFQWDYTLVCPPHWLAQHVPAVVGPCQKHNNL